MSNRRRPQPTGPTPAQLRRLFRGPECERPRWPTQCPDCGAAPDFDSGPAPELVHEASCPIGVGIDRQMALDAAWFEDTIAGPRGTRWRPPVFAEIAEMRIMGAIPRGAVVRGWVRVVQHRRGVRERDFSLLEYRIPLGPGSNAASNCAGREAR